MPTVWNSFPSGQEEKLSIMKNWLHTCINDHPRCKSRWQCQLPSRLIDVGMDESWALKLVSTSSLNLNEVKYTTLSYCWGTQKSLQTTKETVLSYQNQIPPSELPKKFSDAIVTTKKLGLRYVWIDALCIIQDDYDDWETESSKMGDIYHGSILSIAANESQSPSGGVFTQSSSPLAKRTTYARAFLTAINPVNDEKFTIHIVPMQTGPSALNRRGWALQENILSPRLVSITDSELKWSCGFGTFWESGIDYAQSHRIDGSPPNSALYAEKRSRIWWRWMENYLSRRLTCSKDRLPAMLGLINHHQRITQDMPVLGLWESSLNEDLAWMRITTQSERSPCAIPDQNLPSWSPFSCNQAVEFAPWHWDEKGYELGKSCINIIRYEVSWKGTPYLSDVRSSFVEVDGPLQELYLSEVTEVAECNPRYFNIDEEDVDTVNDPLPWRCAVQWDIEGYRPPQSWLCLLLQKRVTQGYEFGGETFLVLETVETQTYRRVGIGSLGRRRTPRGPAEQEWKFDTKARSRIILV